MRGRGPRTSVAGIAAVVVLGCAACTEAGGGPAPTTGSVPAPTASAPGTSQGGIDPTTKFTPLTATLLTTPGPVEISDGKVHLAYELVLTNVTAIPFRVDSVEMHDAATQALVPGSTGRVDLTLLGVGAESEGTTDPGAGTTSVTMPPASTWIAWVDVAFPRASAVPATIDHIVSGAVVPPAGSPVPVRVRIGRADTATGGPAVLGAPVPDGVWYMSEGCCADDTHHRRGLAPVNGTLSVPQRFAIDFYKLDDQHRTWEGDPSKLQSYLTYRQPILAAAAGTVVAAQDGFANSTAVPHPPKVPPIPETVGNHVIVQISDAIYVLYAHMDPGSVAVRVGDRVTRGQQLGLIGNSGNSSTPHLHFQILSTPTFFPSDSKPYAFDRFTLLGRITQRLWDDNLGLEPTGILPFETANPASPHTNALPLDRDVVQFGS
jgi:hypothetical protein